MRSSGWPLAIAWRCFNIDFCHSLANQGRLDLKHLPWHMCFEFLSQDKIIWISFILLYLLYLKPEQCLLLLISLLRSGQKCTETSKCRPNPRSPGNQQSKIKCGKAISLPEIHIYAERQACVLTEIVKRLEFQIDIPRPEDQAQVARETCRLVAIVYILDRSCDGWLYCQKQSCSSLLMDGNDVAILLACVFQ